MSVRAFRMPAVAVGTAAAALIGTVALGGGNNGTVCPNPVGPDVIVGDFHQIANFSIDTITVDGTPTTFDAFSVGTISCNIGNQNLQWFAFSNSNVSLRNNHPAISQNLFKYKVVNGAGRFEQLGQSWLKHGFTALTENTCGCGCNGVGGTFLGIGCSDPYSATRNAGQSLAGPKWTIDASCGYFPETNPAGQNPSYTGPNTGRRLRVKTSDLENSSPSVRYFMEGMYVSQDDAAYGNKDNNASYREVGMSSLSGNYTASLLGITQRQKAGIMAWKAVDPAVLITTVSVPETPNPLADSYPPNPPCCSSATVYVGARATDVGGGIYAYEYAVQNLNSHNSIASFSVPLSEGMKVTDIGFRDVDYHDGDGNNYVTYDGKDWEVTVTSTEIKWTMVPLAGNPANSNAIRWGSMYNFRFRANTPPKSGLVSLGTFRTPTTLQDNSVIPTPIDPPPACPADVTADTLVNVADLLAVIQAWGPCAGCAADVNDDDVVNVADLLAVISAWGNCPSAGK